MRKGWVLLAAVLVACGDTERSPTAVPTMGAPAPGGSRGPKGPKGGDEPRVDDFDVLDLSRWIPGNHGLGKGWLDPANVVPGAGTVLLGLPAGSYDGAEIRSAERYGYGTFEARMLTPAAPGSISAFFLYELRRRQNEEIDIEILNDGSRRLLATTWVRGRMTNHANLPLAFDPSAEFHDYRIEWSRSRVRISVDGQAMVEWTEGLPGGKLYVMSNNWWPTWQEGPVLAQPAWLEIDRIQY